MLYVRDVEDTGKVYVTDTEDGTTEKYSQEEVLTIAKSTEIKGVSEGKISKYDLSDYLSAAMARDKLHGIDSTYEVAHTGDILLSNINLNGKPRYHVLEGTNTIGVGAFIGNKHSFQIVLPNSCHTVEKKAFSYSGVWSINLYRVRYIGDEAFHGCENLVSLAINNDVQAELGNGAFKNSGIIVASLGGTTLIKDNVFHSTKVGEVVMPNVVKVGKSAFENCECLYQVANGYENLVVDTRAFYGCKELSLIKYENISKLGRDCFKGCTELERDKFRDDCTGVDIAF